MLSVAEGISVKEQVAQINRQFADQPVEDLLQWIIAQYGDRFTLACAFGPETIVLIDMLSRLTPNVRAFFLDTEFHFAETLALKAEMERRYPTLQLEVMRPRLTIGEQERLYGPELYRQQPDQCCDIRKVEPMRRALAGYDCWLSGLRQEQSHTRAHTALALWDWQRDMVKINPLVHWTKAQVWRYLLERDLPYNPLLDQGYPSIGCAPCTKQAIPGAEERSGRWQGTAKVECGIHQ